MILEKNFTKIKEIIAQEKKILIEINLLITSLDNMEEKNKLPTLNKIKKLKSLLKELNQKLPREIDFIKLDIKNKNIQPDNSSPHIINLSQRRVFNKRRIFMMEKKAKVSELEKDVIKRLKTNEEKKNVKKEEKSRTYFEVANKFFGNIAKDLVKQKKFKEVTEDLIKSNLEYTAITYLSIFFFNILISLGIALLIYIFFLFFNISSTLPVISLVRGNLVPRAIKLIWIIFVIPLGTFLFMRFLPLLERRSIESKIDNELPFAAIHMAAISGSMINPIKIFSIISSTKEYPHLEREFNKLLNEINVYGYDLISALKEGAKDCPSQKLAELFNGLATTITSGGNIYEFLEKRAQTLLFDYRLEKEKNTKTAESFMDMYISMVIAAPMVLMLLLMMMKLSGLGISLSGSILTFLVTGGVVAINIFFLIFLQIKNSNSE